MKKSSKKYSNGPLIVCMGPSQLVTGLEALRLSGSSLIGVQFIYVGTYNNSLDAFFHEVADCFGLEYVTPPLPGQTPHPLDTTNGINFRAIRWSLNSKKLLRDCSLKIRNDWVNLQNREIVISVRHTVKNDTVLLSILKPSKTILTADGVVLNLKLRSLTGSKWKPLDDTLKELPTNKKVWCPSYLAENVSSYANPSIIPTEGLRRAFKNIRSTPLCKDSECWLSSLPMRPKSILILQQFAQSGVMSCSQEIDMISNLLDELGERKLTPVLIKPHPRDDLCKLRVIDKLLSSDKCVDGYLVPEKYAAIPVETFGLCLDSQSFASIGWTSTSLLSLTHLTGCRLLLVAPPSNAEKFAEQCEEFKGLVSEHEYINVNGYNIR